MATIRRREETPNTSSSLSSISVEAVLLCLVVVFLTAIFVSCIVVPLYRRRVARRTTPSLRSNTDREEEDAEAQQSLLYPISDSEKPEAVSWWLSLKRSMGKMLGRSLRRNPSRPVAVMRVPMPRPVSTPSPSDSYRPSTEPPRSRRSTSSRRGLSIPSPHSPPSSTLPPIPTSPQSPTESLDAAVRLVTNTDPVISFSQYTRPSFDNTRGILVRNHLPTLPPLETLLELPMEEKESSTASRPASGRKRTDDSALALSCVSIPSNLELAPNTHDDQVVQPLERSPSARSSNSSGIFPPSPIIGFSRMSLAKLNTSGIRLSATNSGSPHTPRSTGSRINSSVPMKRKQSTLSLSTPSSQGKTPTPADVTMPLVSASIANTMQVPIILPPPTIDAQSPSSPQSNTIPSPTLPLTTAFNPSSPRRSGTPSSTSTMQIQRWPTVSTVVMGSKDSLPSSTSERDGQASLDVPNDARVARARTVSEGNTHAPPDITHTLRPGRARTFQASASHMPMPNITEVDTPSSGEPVTSAPRSTHASTTSVILQSMSMSGLDSLQAITQDDDEEAVVLRAVPASLQPVRSLPIPPIQTEPPSTSGANATSPSMEPEAHRSEGDPNAPNIHNSSAATIMPPRRNSSRAFSPRPLPTPPTTIVPSIPPQPSTSSMFHSSSDLTARTPPPSELSKYPPSLPHRQSPSTDTLGRPRLHSNTRLSSGYTVQEVHDNLAPAHAASLDITTSLSVPPTEKDIVPSPSGMTAGPSTMTTSPATSSAEITARPVSPMTAWRTRLERTDSNGRHAEVVRRGTRSQDVTNSLFTWGDDGTFGRPRGSVDSTTSAPGRSASDSTPSSQRTAPTSLRPGPLNRSHSTSSTRFVKRRQSPALQPLPAALVLSSLATPSHSRSPSLTGSSKAPEREAVVEIRKPPNSAPVMNSPPTVFSVPPSLLVGPASRRSSAVRFSVGSGGGGVRGESVNLKGSGQLPNGLPPLEFTSWNPEELLESLS